MEYKISEWENGEENVYVFDEFSKLNANKEPEKIANTEFADMLNLYKDQSHNHEFVRRNGFTILGSFPIPGAIPDIVELIEAILDGNRFLLARIKNSDTVYYIPYPFTGSWQVLYTNDYLFRDTRQEHINLLNTLYTGNIIKPDRYTLDNNRVTLNRDGTLYTYPFGLYTDYADRYYMLSANTVTAGLTPSKYYYYGVTIVYDGYMESNISMLKVILLGGSDDTVKLYYNASGFTAFPLAHKRIKQLKIYRSKAVTTPATEAPSVMYYLDTIDVDPAHDTSKPFFVDTREDDSLTELIQASELTKQDAPFNNRYWCFTRNRLLQGNLQSDLKVFGAIPSANITLTASAGTTFINTVKYKFSKVFVKYTGDSYFFILSEPTYKSINVGNTGLVRNILMKVVIADADYYDVFSGWTSYILIERLYGTDDYKPISLQSIADLRAGSGVSDLFSEMSSPVHNGLPFEIDRVKIVGNDYDSPTSFVVSDFEKYESYSDLSSLVVLDRTSNTAIVGMFDEKNRVVIFTDKNIYQLDTEPIDPQFWVTTKLVEGVGAKGARNIKENPLYETSANGILQLPSGGGYMFFNKTYKEANEDDAIIYYWDGQSNSVISISNEISAIINNNNTFVVNSMKYDATKNFVWILINNGEDVILIFDVGKKQWYKWKFTGGLGYFNDIAVLYDGRVAFASNFGFVYKYDTSETLDQATVDSMESFEAYFRTKTYNYPDSLVTGVMLKAEWDALYDAGSLVIRSYANNIYEESVTGSQSGINRAIYRANQPANRVFFEVMFQTERELILKGLSINIKRRNVKYG